MNEIAPELPAEPVVYLARDGEGAMLPPSAVRCEGGRVLVAVSIDPRPGDIIVVSGIGGSVTLEVGP